MGTLKGELSSHCRLPHLLNLTLNWLQQTPYTMTEGLGAADSYAVLPKKQKKNSFCFKIFISDSRNLREKEDLHKHCRPILSSSCLWAYFKSLSTIYLICVFWLLILLRKENQERSPRSPHPLPTTEWEVPSDSAILHIRARPQLTIHTCTSWKSQEWCKQVKSLSCLCLPPKKIISLLKTETHRTLKIIKHWELLNLSRKVLVHLKTDA